MSGAPKRSHEESGHSSSSKYPHEDSGAYPKLSSAVSSEYHPPYEVSQDGRMPKIPRTESRDAERRSPLHSVYRMPSSSNDSHVDHSENRLELRDSKDSRDLRFENRDTKTETRELYSEARRESQNAKGEKDVRSESRGADNKETRYDRESYNDSKGDMKMEKDGYGASNSHLNWKEPKEHQRGKRYPDASGGGINFWHVPRGNSQSPVEVGKEGSTTEERDFVEAHEAVGENKVDSKGEEKLKEKEKKRKDVKHRDWGERDKERGDRRSGMQVANSSSECKESVKEERDVERWERERKEFSKDRERLKEREKDHTRRDSWNGVEKETSHNDKEVGDGSLRMPEQENPAPDQKKQKDLDSWKNVNWEARERRKESNDIEGDRTEKRNRCDDKESDDGCADGEGATEREREVYNYGVQHRKRMQRSRGSPQVTNREHRFRARAQENEGVSGKAEVSSVVYKVGECMQELIKLWKEYKALEAEKSGESSSNGPTLEIRIPAEHVTATNRQVRGGQLWGTDIYTDDSDLVAVLMHTGYCRPTASPPPPAILELRATIRVLPPQDCYISTLRNNVRSRAWGAAIGCSYRVERCCIVKKGGGTIDLEPCLTHTSTVEPTLAPVAVERTMTTRAAASNALRQQRYVREVTIQYNLCNEPWIKYSISIVADKGLKKPLYTSARLKKGEVLYLETHSCRYSYVLEENVDWEDVQWSQTGVWIAGKEYTLARVHFLSMN
ncbi:uncharacterized protein LOC133866374 [Alnus glutinosa]|uniref:uncharacterized protein LOC133866374 n=1 Tax=Alnus glutinosa TaxID=3517 RepID=UPI002D7954A1|nr:uncharacterized protein LOC133866374 [Alnus glutinosa]